MSFWKLLFGGSADAAPTAQEPQPTSTSNPAAVPTPPIVKRTEPQQPVEPQGHDLTVANPILCANGYKAPVAAEAYFRKLHCPAGNGVSFERLGARGTTDMSFLRTPGVVYVAPPGAAEREFAEKDFAERVMLDRYRVVCLCGRHTIDEVFVDVYHRGPMKAVGCAGWTIEGASEDRAPEGSTAGDAGSLDGEWTLVYAGEMVETLKISGDTVESVLDSFRNTKPLVRASPASISGDAVTFGYVLYNDMARSEVVRQLSAKRDSASQLSGTMTSSMTVLGRKDTQNYSFKMSRS